MSNGYSYSYEYDERYCYPKSNVLINKLGITNEKELWEAELEISSLKMARARINKISGDFDLVHLKKSINLYLRISMYGPEKSVG